MKIDLLKNYMQETYGLKIKKMTLYGARAKAWLEVFENHSKECQKLFEYAVAIYKADPRAISKVSCDAVSISDKVLFQSFCFIFGIKKWIS